MEPEADQLNLLTHQIGFCAINDGFHDADVDANFGVVCVDDNS